MPFHKKIPARVRSAHQDRIKEDDATPVRKPRDVTPMMTQYREIKLRYPDAVVFFRMGDFYEMFYDDARTAHKVLGLTLTRRGQDKSGDIPLAGFPHHQLDSYLARMTSSGYKVAVVDQLEDPRAAKGVVKRGVTQVVTAGTAVLDSVLDDKRSHWLAAIAPGQTVTGIALLESASGDFVCYAVPPERVRSELASIAPAELLYPKALRDEFSRLFSALPTTVTTPLDEWLFEEQFARDLLLQHFQVLTLKGYGIDELPEAIMAAGAALHYLKLSQLGPAEQITGIHRGHPEQTMLLDRSTIRHLELIDSSDPTRNTSLFQILDRCQTPMGSRLLRRRILSPLLSVEAIEQRLSQVECFTVPLQERDAPMQPQTPLLSKIRELLTGIGDLHRSAGRIASGRGNPRDAGAVQQTLTRVPTLFSELKELSPFRRIAEIDPCSELNELLQRALNDRLPMSLTEGGVIRTGFNAELDRLRTLSGQGKAALAEFQQQERDRTGIATLSVAYNRVYGYYIEISKAASNNAPDDYQRIQSLVNAERYKTPELQKFEEDVLNAEDKAIELEMKLFAELRTTIAEHHARLFNLGDAIAEIDVAVSLAEVATTYDYRRPQLSDDTCILLHGARHPVLERLVPAGESFIPNDVIFDESTRLLLITGPNMAGKSTYLRTVGINVLMAQIGSFVPALDAEIGVVDRLFTRIGATDNLALGESTFLVEMNEASYLINNATSRSLILLDEVGRGTSTFDGLAIAWAMVERLATRPMPPPRTLFATHYHELTVLEEHFPTVQNWNVQVKEVGDSILFLRKIIRGPCDRSYGIHVARLAGMPPDVVLRAEEVLELLQQGALAPESSARLAQQRKKLVAQTQLSLFDFEDVSLRTELQGVDTDNLTPMEALQRINEWKQRYGKPIAGNRTRKLS
ncbi:MAG: DNA mismatch repair protein MutS [bacterium]|nr:DNA mismatch repair protein MutS [bacterium]